jgi:regulatory protein
MPKITAITAQQKDKNRVNIMVDGIYRLSLNIAQVWDLGVKVGKEYEETELEQLTQESQFGRTYGRALEYCLMRPHSAREVKDYLYRKTRDTRGKDGQVKKGVSPEVTIRVFEQLVTKGYVDDEKFARYWVENRNLTKGMSKRKLMNELRAKGVESSIIEKHVRDSDRADISELAKVIAKKRARYSDDQKFMQYLARQGFSYDDIKAALAEE